METTTINHNLCNVQTNRNYPTIYFTIYSSIYTQITKTRNIRTNIKKVVLWLYNNYYRKETLVHNITCSLWILSVFHWTNCLYLLIKIQMSFYNMFNRDLFQISFCPTTNGLSDTGGSSGSNFLDPCPGGIPYFLFLKLSHLHNSCYN